MILLWLQIVHKCKRNEERGHASEICERKLLLLLLFVN